VDSPPVEGAGFRSELTSREYVGLLVFLIVGGAALRVGQLGHSLYEDFSFRQTQTALIARNYAESGIDLRHSPLTVFGPRSDVPIELPLPQAAAALLQRLGLGPDFAMRLVGLSGFVLAAVVLALLVHRWHGRRAAVVTTAVFQLTPFSLLWGGAALIDFPATGVALTMVLLADTWFRGGRPWLLPLVGAVSALAFLVKPTTAPVYCVLVLFAGLAALARARGEARPTPRFRSSPLARVLVGLVTVGVPGLVAAGLWTRYADGIKHSQPLVRFLESSALWDWNFGTTDQRLDPDDYWVIGERLGTEVLGVVPLVVLFALVAVATSSGPERILRAGWLVSACAGPLIFFNLYVVHTYYLSGIYPALVVVVALAVEGVVEVTRSRPTLRVVMSVAIVGSLASTFFTEPGRHDASRLWQDMPRPYPSAVIASHVPPREMILMIGCDWDPTFAYYAHRTALMFTGADAGHYWAHHDVTRVHWLYSCNPELAPGKYLPAGVKAQPAEVPGLYLIAAR
jgi:4-amino-4-deoxy-L-arabinose transferase-like glycosyltransferase